MSMFLNNKLKPMLLKEISKPFIDHNYIFEIKFDGIRALIHVNDKTIKIINRNGHSLNDVFPELLDIKNNIKKNVVFDGEIIALEGGRPSFKLLQKRNMLKNKLKIEQLVKETPVSFVVFDILYENKDLTSLPLIDRKKLLNKYKDTNIFVKTKYIKNDGINYFKQIKKLNLEGIIAKEINSKYYPNVRSNVWLKIKNQKDDDFYVCGYLEGKGNLSSLLLGEKINNKIEYIGKVTIGKSNPDLKIIKTHINESKLIKYHNHNYIYIRPVLKCTVKYIERTSLNALRQPIYKSLKQ